MWGFEALVIAAMIGVNSVFAAYEIALASVSTARLQRLVQEQRSGAKKALHMKENMESSLAVVQLGITLVGVIAAAVGGAGAGETLAPALMSRFGISEATAEAIAIVLVVVPLTAVTIIVGELIPKVFALRNAERVVLTLSPFMRAFSISVWPAVWLFETIVVGVMSWGERRFGSGDAPKPEKLEIHELKATISLARASRLIGHLGEKIIVGATELEARAVRDIMVSVEHMSTLFADATLTENLLSAQLEMRTRFPVVARRDDPQSVVGYVNFKDIVAAMRLGPPEPMFRSIIRPIPSFEGGLQITTCLEQMMKEHTHIALVRVADSRVVGMVTLEDILEELVGEIEDEYDRLPAHVVEHDAARGAVRVASRRGRRKHGQEAQLTVAEREAGSGQSIAPTPPTAAK